MTTLYRVLVLSLLLYIVALLLGKQAVTSVAPTGKRQNQAIPNRLHSDPLGLASFDERQAQVDRELRLEN